MASDGRSQQLEKCARLLSSKSTDDEKLAGLLLVPRIVDAQDVESLDYILSAMDGRFIERLLRTGMKQATEQTNSPAIAGPPMLDIAVSVVDVFASHGALAQRPQIIDRMVSLCSVVFLALPHIDSSDSNSSVSSSSVSSDAAQVLCKLLATDQAVERLLAQPGMLAGVIQSVGRRSPPNSLEITQFLDYALSRCSQWLHLQQKQKPKQHWPSTQSAAGWVELVSSVACLFAQAQTERELKLKLDLVPVLASALAPLDSTDAVAIDDSASCAPMVADIRSGCVWIMTVRQRAPESESNGDYFDQALVLASHVVRLWPHLVFSPATSGAGDTEAQKASGGSLILRLACVEGQTTIDSMMIRAPPDQSSIQLSGVVATDAERLRLGWKLPLCAEIAASWLEWADKWPDTQDDPAAEASSADEAAVYSMMGDVKKLAESAVVFLRDWNERVRGHQAMLAASPALVASTIRLLGRWLATDTKLHTQALPVLAMCAGWIVQSANQYGQALSDYMLPSVSFALETCEVDEAQYVDDLKTHRLRHKAKKTHDFASPWVGTIEFDDLARAVYGIPSDEEMLRQRQTHKQ
ncbi:hypothetical protein LPJ72_001824 [Coemansia sp. Benny D160-2]|nr:hypothetical protein LPJ72_001824 [Coemansia sp. Benny D160-2]